MIHADWIVQCKCTLFLRAENSLWGEKYTRTHAHTNPHQIHHPYFFPVRQKYTHTFHKPSPIIIIDQTSCLSLHMRVFLHLVILLMVLSVLLKNKCEQACGYDGTPEALKCMVNKHRMDSQKRGKNAMCFNNVFLFISVWKHILKTK